MFPFKSGTVIQHRTDKIEFVVKSLVNDYLVAVIGVNGKELHLNQLFVTINFEKVAEDECNR